ncbi:MAG: MlaA family lipoprotein [Caulobacteraceae bacterium]
MSPGGRAFRITTTISGSRWVSGASSPAPICSIPFLGPSTVRDSLGSGVDVLLNPFTYIRFPGRLTLQYTTVAVGTLDRRLNSQAGFEALTADAAEPLRHRALGLPAIARSGGPGRGRVAGTAADRRTRAGGVATGRPERIRRACVGARDGGAARARSTGGRLRRGRARGHRLSVRHRPIRPATLRSGQLRRP